MKRVLLTGATGFVGSRLRQDLSALGWEIRGTSRRPAEGLLALALETPGALESLFEAERPDAVVHTAAISSPDEAELDPKRAWAVNAEAAGRLASLCAERGARLIHFSTDLVFDGSTPMSSEEQSVAPISVYGRTKAQAEKLILELCPSAVVLRVCAIYGRSLSRPSFFDTLACELEAGRTVKAICDQWRTATYGPQLTPVIDALLRRPRLRGLFHWGGAERATRLEFASLFCEVSGLDRRLIAAVRSADVSFAGPRPADVSLDSSRLSKLLGLAPMPLRQGLTHAWAERREGR